MPFLADVARFARSLARDEARADDLVQDTYLQAMRGWHTFQIGSDPRRWLFTICHNMFLRTIRREARYVEAPEDDPELDSMATAKAHWRAMDAGVADIVDRMDLADALNRALGELPEHYRSVVVLIDAEGYSYEDAAVMLDIALGTVRSRLFRARRLLQDMLFDYARDAHFKTAR
jgi:RNA polymerase sigma-70 factor (ECF subfamily)